MPCWATSRATRDGKIDQFIDRRDVKRTLPLHPFEGEPYYLGAFLIGAYQEILGDMHNLFGDTNAVHVEHGRRRARWCCENVIKGDTVREVLDYVEFEPDALVRSCGMRPRRPFARIASATKRPAGSSNSTRKGCKATRIWKSQSSARRRASTRRSENRAVFVDCMF